MRGRSRCSWGLTSISPSAIVARPSYLSRADQIPQILAPMQRFRNQPGDLRRASRSPRGLCSLLVVALLLWAPAALSMQRFQADEWVTECGRAPATGSANCSIMVPFWQLAEGGMGSFALVVMLQTGNIGIVGSPAPVRAVLRVDKGQPVTCRAARYCIFPAAQSLEMVKQLAKASLILIDVYTARSQFSFSLSPMGYQAGIAQVRAWGYQPIGN